MPGISDSRINAGGKMSFSGTKAVSNSIPVAGEITQQVSTANAQMLDLQGRLTLLEAKFSAATMEAAQLAEVVKDLTDRLAALETPSQEG